MVIILFRSFYSNIELLVLDFGIVVIEPILVNEFPVTTRIASIRIHREREREKRQQQNSLNRIWWWSWQNIMKNTSVNCLRSNPLARQKQQKCVFFSLEFQREKKTVMWNEMKCSSLESNALLKNLGWMHFNRKTTTKKGKRKCGNIYTHANGRKPLFKC